MSNVMSIANLPFIRIPAGPAVVGSEHCLDNRPRWERFSEVWIGKAPVTGDQYRRVVPEAAEAIAPGDQPATYVSWEDAVRFIQRSNSAFRLPTGAEWEKGMRKRVVVQQYMREKKIQNAGQLIDYLADPECVDPIENFVRSLTPGTKIVNPSDRSSFRELIDRIAGVSAWFVFADLSLAGNVAQWVTEFEGDRDFKAVRGISPRVACLRKVPPHEKNGDIGFRLVAVPLDIPPPRRSSSHRTGWVPTLD